MRKGTFIFILSLFFISCQEKTKVVQKTYEQLEAEVLCDVLPDVIKDFCKKQYLLLPPPISIDYSVFSKTNQDSIHVAKVKEWKKLNAQIHKTRADFIKQIPEHKKVTFGVVDSLWSITSKKIKGTENYFISLYDSLDTRAVYDTDFLNCSVIIKTVSTDSIFEGEVRNNPDLRVIGLSRVLIAKPQENAYFEVYQYFYLKKICCIYSNEKKKWIINEIKEYE